MDRPTNEQFGLEFKQAEQSFFGQAGDQLEQGWGYHDPDKHTLNGALCDARE
jgi:hypothetical protein